MLLTSLYTLLWMFHTCVQNSLYQYVKRLLPCMQEFSTILHSWLTLFTFMMTLSGFDNEMFYNCTNPEAATFLMVLFMFVVAVIFLNLLIGIMADSWKQVSLHVSATGN